MKRPRLTLVALAPLLAACAAGSSAPVDNNFAGFGFGSHRLLRLANYEGGSKVDIAVDGAQPSLGRSEETRHALAPKDVVAKVNALWQAIAKGPVGRPVEWANADTGSHGYALILREVAIPDSDRFCREYREDAVIEGSSETELGQACQLRDGSWSKIEG